MNYVKKPELNKLMLTTSWGEVMRQFVLFFPPIFLLLIGLFFYVEYQHHIALNRAKHTTNEHIIQMARQTLTRDLDLVALDLALLTHSDEMQQLLITDTQQNREALEKRFLSLARDRRIYDQMRYIDNSGQEQVRVNINGNLASTVSRDRLQNKSERYYFRQALTLPVGKLLISSINANIEQGQIERPIKPVYRAILRLKAPDSKRGGFLVLNYLAAPMLARMRTIFPKDSDTNFGLVNQAGCWIDPPPLTSDSLSVAEHEECIDKRFPRAWQEMHTKETGQIKTKHGVFTFSIIAPGIEINRKTGHEASHDDIQNFWGLLAYTPPETLSFIRYLHDNSDVQAISLIILLSATIAAWFRSRVQAVRKRWQSLTNLLFHAIDQSPAAVVLTDAKGSTEYVNDRFCLLSGYSAEQVIGQNPRILKSDDKSSEEYKELWDTITSGLTWTGEFHNRASDGSEYFVRAQISPIRDNKGKIAWFIGLQEDVTEARKLHHELEKQATTDPLTGLLNRRKLFYDIETEISRAQRYKFQIGLLAIDLDHFKQVNDVWGHAAGDEVLRQVSRLMQYNIRNNDILGRYGGEEFILALPQTELQQASSFAERLRKKIEAHEIHYEQTIIKVKVSIGCTEWYPDEKTMDAMLKRSDVALYQAKENGRNQVVVYSENA